MDPRKFDKDVLDKLPPELQRDIKEGKVIAVPLVKPALTGTWFSAILAVTLFFIAIPLFLPVNAFMVVGNGIGCLGWFLAYAVTSRMACMWQNKYRFVTGLNEGIIKMVEKTLAKQQDTDGTKPDSDCLKKERSVNKEGDNEPTSKQDE